MDRWMDGLMKERWMEDEGWIDRGWMGRRWMDEWMDGCMGR